jgi:hypothetical protein
MYLRLDSILFSVIYLNAGKPPQQINQESDMKSSKKGTKSSEIELCNQLIERLSQCDNTNYQKIINFNMNDSVCESGILNYRSPTQIDKINMPKFSNISEEKQKLLNIITIYYHILFSTPVGQLTFFDYYKALDKIFLNSDNIEELKDILAIKILEYPFNIDYNIDVDPLLIDQANIWLNNKKTIMSNIADINHTQWIGGFNIQLLSEDDNKTMLNILRIENRLYLAINKNLQKYLELINQKKPTDSQINKSDTLPSIEPENNKDTLMSTLKEVVFKEDKILSNIVNDLLKFTLDELFQEFQLSREVFNQISDIKIPDGNVTVKSYCLNFILHNHQLLYENTKKATVYQYLCVILIKVSSSQCNINQIIGIMRYFIEEHQLDQDKKKDTIEIMKNIVYYRMIEKMLEKTPEKTAIVEVKTTENNVIKQTLSNMLNNHIEKNYANSLLSQENKSKLQAITISIEQKNTLLLAFQKEITELYKKIIYTLYVLKIIPTKQQKQELIDMYQKSRKQIEEKIHKENTLFSIANLLNDDEGLVCDPRNNIRINHFDIPQSLLEPENSLSLGGQHTKSQLQKVKLSKSLTIPPAHPISSTNSTDDDNFPVPEKRKSWVFNKFTIGGCGVAIILCLIIIYK